MKKRDFLKTAGILGSGLLVAPLAACKQVVATSVPEPTKPQPTSALQEFSLPPLGYAFNALEPSIDAVTMAIHHDKHHGAYVTNLNKALAADPVKWADKTLEQICMSLDASSAPAIRNNAGGHWNHSMFWKWIKPGGSKTPNDALSKAIQSSFGSYEEFSKQFSDAAKTRFGSGWAWLCVGPDKKLFITSTPNQDNPLMKQLVEKPGTPILGIDVWEHAYYLHYQNKRPDYISAFMGLINWDEVALSYQAAK